MVISIDVHHVRSFDNSEDYKYNNMSPAIVLGTLVYSTSREGFTEYRDQGVGIQGFHCIQILKCSTVYRY